MKNLSLNIPLFSPNHKTKITWDVFMIITVFFASLITPYRILSGNDHFDSIYWFITIIFTLDILINFNTKLKIKMSMISNRKIITFTYLKTWFTIDFLAAFPLAPLMLYFSGRPMEQTLIFNIYLALMFLRLLKLVKIKATFTNLQEILTINPTIIRLIIFSFWFALVLHFIALGWIAIGAGEQVGLFKMKYLRALYWCITTIATVGYGDITPDRNNVLQMIYTMFVQLIGVGTFGYIIGNIASLIANIDVAKSEFSKKMGEVKEYMRLKKLPYHLQDKVLDYYRYIWLTQKSIDRKNFLDELPHTLNTEISLFLNKNILEKVSLFKDSSEIFIREVVRLLEPIVFLPDDYIIHQGEYGDSMYFINSGEVEVIVNAQKVTTLGAGSFFGETALIQGENRTASIKALDYCDTYKLSKQSFDTLREKYPEFDQNVKEIMVKRQHKSPNNA